MNSSHHSWDATPTSTVGDDCGAEKLAAIRTIRRLMDFWQIGLEELSGVEFKPRPPSATPSRVAHHYQHPVHGSCWNGRGAQPDWLKDALLKEGYTVDQLRVAALPSDGKDVP